MSDECHTSLNDLVERTTAVAVAGGSRGELLLTGSPVADDAVPSPRGGGSSATTAGGGRGALMLTGSPVVVAGSLSPLVDSSDCNGPLSPAVAAPAVCVPSTPTSGLSMNLHSLSMATPNSSAAAGSSVLSPRFSLLDDLLRDAPLLASISPTSEPSLSTFVEIKGILSSLRPLGKRGYEKMTIRMATDNYRTLGIEYLQSKARWLAAQSGLQEEIERLRSACKDLKEANGRSAVELAESRQRTASSKLVNSCVREQLRKSQAECDEQKMRDRQMRDEMERAEERQKEMQKERDIALLKVHEKHVELVKTTVSCATKEMQLKRKASDFDRVQGERKKLMKKMSLTDERKAWSEIGDDQRRRRAANVIASIDHALRIDLAASKGGNSDDCESFALEACRSLIECLQRNHKEHAFICAMMEREKKGKKFSPYQDVSYSCSQGLTQTKRDGWKRIFLSCNLNDPFISSATFRIARDVLAVSRYMAHFTVVHKETEIKITGLDRIEPVLAEYCRLLYITGKLVLHKEKLRILNIGDGGGGLTKMGLVLIDTPQCQSANNILVYLVYDGGDDSQTLRTVAGRWAEELNAMTHISFNADGGTVTYELEWFLGGDYKFLCACYGHIGQSARYPCLVCYVHKDDKIISKRRKIPLLKFSRQGDGEMEVDVCKKDGKTKSLATHRMRTLESYHADAAVDGYSVSDVPLFSVPVKNIAIPVLHDIQGAFYELEDIAERFAINEHILDKQGTELLANLPSDTSKNRRAKENTEEKIAELEREEREIALAISLFQMSKLGCIDRSHNACSALCIVGSRRTRTQFHSGCLKLIKCDDCGTTGVKKHMICNGLVTKEVREQALKEQAEGNFICKGCDREWMEDEMIASLEKQVEAPRAARKNMEAALLRMEKRGQELDKLREEKGGPVLAKLEAAFKSVGADKQAFYQRYTGNHVRKALTGEGPKTICAAFDRSKTPLADVLERAFTLLGEMQSAGTATDISEEQIDKYRRDKNAFFHTLAELKPDCSMRPKLHLLDCHVFQFMKRHNTWGRVQEQSIESKHARWNEKARIHSNSKRDVWTQRERILNDLYLESFNFAYPDRDLTEEIALWKELQSKKITWSEHKGVSDDRPARPLPETDYSLWKAPANDEDEPASEWDTDIEVL